MVPTPPHPPSGQALIETVVAGLLAMGVFIGGAHLLRSSWERFRCLSQLFDRGHAALMGDLPGFLPKGGWVQVSDRCGSRWEELRFETLESIQAGRQGRLPVATHGTPALPAGVGISGHTGPSGDLESSGEKSARTGSVREGDGPSDG